MFCPELNDGALLDPHEVTSSWHDREINQIKALTNLLRVELCENNFTLNKKQSGARSGVD